MENASKALLIAGAVLIVILIISVGIVIFNSSKGLFGSATSSMSEQEQLMFNSKFTMYEGTNVSGTQVRELLRTVITNNTNDKENPVVTVNNGVTLTSTSSSIYWPGTSTPIPTTDRYTVTCKIDKDTRLVYNIEISNNKK